MFTNTNTDTDSIKFKAADFASKFNNILGRFKKLLSQADDNDASTLIIKLEEELREHQQRGFLDVAFIGQYNAGKSTIISALTNCRDIKIDSDITTDKTVSYDWNSIKLTDTPGLYTERKDHDDITYEELRKADLLIYTLTYMLFDSITLKNFKKLAFDLRYQPKMLLVVNKLSNEAGDVGQRIQYYRESLDESIAPHELADFPCCFIDALDYLEGIDNEDDFLKKESRFENFISALNEFVDKRGKLGRIDVPARILLTCIDEAELHFNRADGKDTAYLELLNSLSRRVRDQRQRLRSHIDGILLDLSGKISNQGHALLPHIGTNDNMEEKAKEAEKNIERLCQKTQERLEEAVSESIEKLREQVQEVLSSPLANAFAATLFDTNKKVKVTPQEVTSLENLKHVKAQWQKLAGIGAMVGVQVSRMAIGKGGQAASGLLKASQVSGSQLHSIILTVGKFFGTKFKPWQAVNIATKTAKFAKFLGPAIALVSLGIDSYEAYKENQQAKEISEARMSVNTKFNAIANDIEDQYRQQLRQIEKETFDQVDKDINEARREHETAISTSNEYLTELASLREETNDIIKQLG